jgi:Holliday junction DNA helicase RuvA
MFYYIKGLLVAADQNYAVLDVGGVGYKLTVSGNTRSSLPPFRSVKEPPTVLLYTHFAVREDDVELFGFSDEEELKTFRALTNVSGIGPKAAMSILSALTPQKLALAVASEDKKAIAAANGIGAKTAARVILELKDKMTFISDSDVGEAFKEQDEAPAATKGSLSEAAAALSALGYSKPEIANALKDADPSMSVDMIIKQALKKLF